MAIRMCTLVDHLSMMDYLAAGPARIDDDGTATLFIDGVFRQQGFLWQLSLIETLVLLGSFGSHSSRFLAHD